MAEVGEINQSFETKVEVALTRIEERQVAAKDDLAGMREQMKSQFEQVRLEATHKHNNLRFEMDKYEKELERFVPRSEIEAMNRETQQHCDTNRAAVVARVDTLTEKVDRFGSLAAKLLWSLVSLAGTAALGLLTWFVKMALSGATL